MDREGWRGLLEGRRDPKSPPLIEVALQPSTRGGSGTFLAADSDQRQWWVKPLNNRQGGKVVVTEHVVGKAGALIGAPVCEVAVVELPAELTGWEFRPGAVLEPGLAHGSAAVVAALEDRGLSYRDRDDNRVRHAGVVALYDWCWGGDDQWLYAEQQDRMLYSHDHGWYLPENGHDWNETTLMRRMNEPHPINASTHDLDAAELHRLAERLRGLSRQELVDMLKRVPTSWPVSNDELEALGWFLESRASEVADRLSILAVGAQ